MTTFTITTDGDDITLWRTPGNAFGPEALLRQPAVHPDVWAMLAQVVELGGPERVRAGVELAEATVAHDDALIAMGAVTFGRAASDDVESVFESANDALDAALDRFRGAINMVTKPLYFWACDDEIGCGAQGSLGDQESARTGAESHRASCAMASNTPELVEVRGADA